jgi:LytR cell envelope-related transcriptional attenuator
MTAALPASFAPPAPRISNILLTAARGAALIGLAVVIGIVLLQVVDNPTGGSDGNSSDTTTVTTGSDSDNGDNGNTTNGVDPAQVSVIVLNGAGVAGAAGQQSDAIGAQGYQMEPPTNATATQDPTTVACNAETQAAVEPLIALVPGATAAEYPTNPQPPEAAAADCIVTLGTSFASAPPST